MKNQDCIGVLAAQQKSAYNCKSKCLKHFSWKENV